MTFRQLGDFQVERDLIVGKHVTMNGIASVDVPATSKVNLFVDIADNKFKSITSTGLVRVYTTESNLNDHASLTNLDYASAGHTGFIGTDEMIAHTSDAAIHLSTSQVYLVELADVIMFAPMSSDIVAFDGSYWTNFPLSNLATTSQVDLVSSRVDAISTDLFNHTSDSTIHFTTSQIKIIDASDMVPYYGPAQSVVTVNTSGVGFYYSNPVAASSQWQRISTTITPLYTGDVLDMGPGNIQAINAHFLGKLTVDGAIDPTELDMPDNAPVYLNTAKTVSMKSTGSNLLLDDAYLSTAVPLSESGVTSIVTRGGRTSLIGVANKLSEDLDSASSGVSIVSSNLFSHTSDATIHFVTSQIRHSDIQNLDYASSGHLGFSSTSDVNIISSRVDVTETSISSVSSRVAVTEASMISVSSRVNVVETDVLVKGTDTKIATGIPVSERSKFKLTTSTSGANVVGTIDFVGANTDFSYYINDKKYTVTTSTISAYAASATASEGTWFFYINQNTTDAASPVMSLSKTPWTIADPDVLLWNFYYDNTNSTFTWVGEERHTAGRDIFNHARNHAQGALYKSGLLFSQYNGLTTFSANTDNNFGRAQTQVAGGSFFDEDIQNNITHTDASITSTVASPATDWNLTVNQYLGFNATNTSTTAGTLTFATPHTFVTGQPVTVMQGNTTTVRGTFTIDTGATGTSFVVTTVTGSNAFANNDIVVVGARIPIYYVSAVAGGVYTWRKLTTTDFLGVSGGVAITPSTIATAVCQYNNAVAGGFTAMTSTRYYPIYLLATNSTNEPVIAILGQGQSTNATLATALGEAPFQFNNVAGLSYLGLQEVVPFYRLTYQYSSAAGFNQNRMRLSDATFLNVRVATVSGSVLGSPTASISASQVFNDTTNFNSKLSTADTTVQAALDTLDDHNHNELYATSSTIYWSKSGTTLLPITQTDNVAVTSNANIYFDANKSYFEGYHSGVGLEMGTGTDGVNFTGFRNFNATTVQMICNMNACVSATGANPSVTVQSNGATLYLFGNQDIYLGGQNLSGSGVRWSETGITGLLPRGTRDSAVGVINHLNTSLVTTNSSTITISQDLSGHTSDATIHFTTSQIIHSELQNLSFASSGHTGFASTSDINSVSDNLLSHTSIIGLHTDIVNKGWNTGELVESSTTVNSSDVDGDPTQITETVNGLTRITDIYYNLDKNPWKIEQYGSMLTSYVSSSVITLFDYSSGVETSSWGPMRGSWRQLY